jgi:hypothetical protein
VRKYDINGNELWTRQFGTTGADDLSMVASDGVGVYVVGLTTGSLPGQQHNGGEDAFVRRYDVLGNEVWTRQFGTASIDRALGLALDATGVYVSGLTNGTLPGQNSAGGRDAYVRKYDRDGNELWTRQFGSTSNDDAATNLATDHSGLYVAGFVAGSLPSQITSGDRDAFVRRYDPSGSEQWTRQFGTATEDRPFGLVADASGAYVVGHTNAGLPGQVAAGGTDAFARKYDVNGNELWTRQFGTSGADRGLGATADPAALYIVGDTHGALPGQTSAGEVDAFLRVYDRSGNELFTQQLGTEAVDQAIGAVVGNPADLAAANLRRPDAVPLAAILNAEQRITH